MSNQDPQNKKLFVSKGVQQPSSLNPRAIQNYKSKKARNLSLDQYLKGILEGDRTILSRAITLIESNLHDDQALAQQIVERCLPHSGNSIRIGITGVPGVGKSTFIEAFGIELINEGSKVAVLAVDPSSEKTKGSILGDKTRMANLSVEKNAFIRPSPSSGTLGGVAQKSRETIILCEAAGFDKILVETVGVGQSETAVLGRHRHLPRHQAARRGQVLLAGDRGRRHAPVAGPALRPAGRPAVVARPHAARACASGDAIGWTT